MENCLLQKLGTKHDGENNRRTLIRDLHCGLESISPSDKYPKPQKYVWKYEKQPADSRYFECDKPDHPPTEQPQRYVPLDSPLTAPRVERHEHQEIGVEDYVSAVIILEIAKIHQVDQYDVDRIDHGRRDSAPKRPAKDCERNRQSQHRDDDYSERNAQYFHHQPPSITCLELPLDLVDVLFAVTAPSEHELLAIP